jgi:hypothetical protein
MRVVSAFLALLFAAVIHLPVAARPACADSALKLSEILAGPATDWDQSGAFSSRDDEWVEVVNVGIASLDLQGFFLTDGDSIPRFAFSGTLGAGAQRVVYGKESTDWERANGFPVFGLSLANTGDSVLLWQVVGAETTLVDSYSYRSHEAAADRSVARAVGTGVWTVFDGLNPYTGTTPPLGNGCRPTPGTPNACSTTPARSESWGAIKRAYR